MLLFIKPTKCTGESRYFQLIYMDNPFQLTYTYTYNGVFFIYENCALINFNTVSEGIPVRGSANGKMSLNCDRGSLLIS